MDALFGTLIGASVEADAARGRALLRHVRRRRCCGRRSLTEVAYAALLGGRPAPADLFAFQTLVGLLLTNGPGTISAQGAKGAVVGRRAGAAGARAAQQGHGRLSHPFRLRARRQRLRGHRLPASTSSATPGWKIRPTRTTGSTCEALAARYTEEYARYKSSRKNGRQPGHPEDPGRQPPGVQGQAGQPRPARGLHARAVRASAASTTSSTSSTTRWCRRCSTPACRATSTASTSTR